VALTLFLDAAQKPLFGKAMNAFIQSILLKGLSALNMVPVPVLDTTGPVMRARIIIAATEMGVFEALADGPKAYSELAERIGARGDSLRLILDALEGYGYIWRSGDRYENSRMARKYLEPKSPYYVGDLVLFQEDSDAMIRSLTKVVRTGEIDSNHEDYMREDPKRWRRYVLGMREGARLSVREVGAKVSAPPGARRLLDLGGSHGLHAYAFCERNPKLRAVVFDRPEAIQIAKEISASLPVRDRVSFQAGDIWSDSFGEDYDIVLLFSVIHLFSRERNQELLARVANATRPGGMLVVADFLSDRLPADWIAAFSLGMRCFFGQGQAYDRPTIRGWLNEAGFEKVRVSHLRNPASLIIGYRSHRGGS
jgi:SAM-dependent methyltransferase